MAQTKPVPSMYECIMAHNKMLYEEAKAKAVAKAEAEAEAALITKDFEAMKARFEAQKCFENINIADMIAYFKGKTFTVVEPKFFRCKKRDGAAAAAAGLDDDADTDDEHDTGAMCSIDFSSGGIGARITFAEVCGDSFGGDDTFCVKQKVYFRGDKCEKEVIYKPNGTIASTFVATAAIDDGDDSDDDELMPTPLVRKPQFIIVFNMTHDDKLDRDTRRLDISELKKKYKVRDETGGITLVGIFTRYFRFVANVTMMNEFERLNSTTFKDYLLYHTTWEHDIHTVSKMFPGYGTAAF